MVAFGGKLLLAMYGSHSGASRLCAVWRLSAFWRVRYRRFHCIYINIGKIWIIQQTREARCARQLYIYNFIYIFQAVRRARAINAQTSDRPVEVQCMVNIIALKTATLFLSCS